MSERIYGPYEHHGRQRLILRGRDGSVTKTFEGEGARAEALAFKTKWLEATKGHTVRAAIDAYLAHRKQKGKKNGEPLSPDTIEMYKRRLQEFLDDTMMVTDLTPKRCGVLYEKRTTKVKPDTHRGELQTAAAFAEWCVRQGWLTGQHFRHVDPVGQLSTGKAQLTIDEARAFADTALDLGDEGAIAALCALLFGVRSSEVTNRIVRDLDDAGRLLRITKSKTKKGKRPLEVPEVLRAPLLELAEDKPSTGWLFPDAHTWVLPRHWLLDHVRRVCKAAGVPLVCTHGLRGTHASLAVEAGATSHVVSAALGHAHVGVTNRHYIDVGAKQYGQQRAALSVLDVNVRKRVTHPLLSGDEKSSVLNDSRPQY